LAQASIAGALFLVPTVALWRARDRFDTVAPTSGGRADMTRSDHNREQV
jgi:hypothetical protein